MVAKITSDLPLESRERANAGNAVIAREQNMRSRAAFHRRLEPPSVVDDDGGVGVSPIHTLCPTALKKV
jgi:predicted fused transcriptional regulator/phosphomethylpyrimidine kinase